MSKSASQRNLSEGYMSHTRGGGDSGFADGTHTLRSPRQNVVKGNYSAQSDIESRSGDEQWKQIGVMPAKNPQEDLRHWQQQHQEELLHQHLETQVSRPVGFGCLLDQIDFLDQFFVYFGCSECIF